MDGDDAPFDDDMGDDIGYGGGPGSDDADVYAET